MKLIYSLLKVLKLEYLETLQKGDMYINSLQYFQKLEGDGASFSNNNITNLQISYRPWLL